MLVCCQDDDDGDGDDDDDDGDGDDDDDDDGDGDDDDLCNWIHDWMFMRRKINEVLHVMMMMMMILLCDVDKCMAYFVTCKRYYLT